MILARLRRGQAGAPAGRVDRREMHNEHLLVIELGRAERHYWRDLWRYRELLQVLASRDVAVRYKQTVIGVAWAVIRPLLTMVFSPSFSASSLDCHLMAAPLTL